MRSRRTATWKAGRRPDRSSSSPSQRPGSRLKSRPLLDPEDGLGLAEGGHRFAVLAGLVELLAFVAQLLHFGRLLGVELGLGQGRVDRLDFVGAVVGPGERSKSGEDYGDSETFHLPSGWYWTSPGLGSA